MPKHRLAELDGIRGWAALSVILFHIFWESFGVLEPGFRNPFTFFFLNGRLAVAVFFLLSGEALSAGYLATRDESAVASLALKRYPRLTIPILASSLIIYLLVRFQAVHTVAAANVIHRPDWLGTFLVKTPTGFFYMLRYAIFDVYTEQTAWLKLNPFLWTMHFELIGSMLVFTILMGMRHVRHAWALIVMAALGLSLLREGPNYYACFLFGICFGSLRLKGTFDTARASNAIQLLSWAAMAALFAISALIPVGHRAINSHPGIFAAPLLLAVFTNRHLSAFFSSRPLRLLGAISFPLYLLQFPVYASFMSGAVLRASANGGLTGETIWIIAFETLSMCVIAAILFLPVEILTRKAGNLLSSALIIRAKQRTRMADATG